MANTLVCLCSCHWWTFWTYLVTVSLFSLYLMNSMFHTTLDAVGNIVRVHYKSMKCDVSFSQGSVSTLFRWGEHVFHVCVNVLPAYNSAKKYKNQTSFSIVMITNLLPRFLMKHSVYISPARVVPWLDHLGAMCSRAWRAQCAVGSRFNSSRGPGKACPPT